MPYRKEKFVNGKIYHVVIRSIDDNLLFKNINDYYRGIFSIYEFNNTKSATIRERRRVRLQIKKLLSQRNRTDENKVADTRNKLVEILAFCFMPNHIHLLLRQVRNNGIEKFMLKIGTGYGGYFNRKYKRKGHVFQNRFKAVHVKTDAQLKATLTYIHTNPISLIEPGWKNGKVKNKKRSIKFLKSYKWSSYQDYIGKNNFPSVTEREFLLEIMGGAIGCQNTVIDWIKYKKGIKGFNKSILE